MAEMETGRAGLTDGEQTMFVIQSNGTNLSTRQTVTNIGGTQTQPSV